MTTYQLHCLLLLLLQEQYKFCFEMVLAFLAEFETYANFTWKREIDVHETADIRLARSEAKAKSNIGQVIIFKR